MCVDRIDERAPHNPTWTKVCNLAQALDITLHQLLHAAEAEAYGAVSPLAHRR